MTYCMPVQATHTLKGGGGADWLGGLEGIEHGLLL